MCAHNKKCISYKNYKRILVLKPLQFRSSSNWSAQSAFRATKRKKKNDERDVTFVFYRFLKFSNEYSENRRLSGSMYAHAGGVYVRRRAGRRTVSHAQSAMLSAGPDKRHRLVLRECYRRRAADLDRRVHDDDQGYHDFYADTRGNYHGAQHVCFLHFGKNYTGASFIARLPSEKIN